MSTQPPNSTADNVTIPWNLTTTTRAPVYDNQPWPGMTTAMVVFTVFIAVVNIGLPAIILTNNSLRSNRLYWHIISACFWDAFFGLFFIPLNLRHQAVKRWEHGDHICRWVVIMDFAHIAMAAGILTCVCLHRILTIVHAYRPIRPKVILACNVGLLVCPWLFLFCVCIPLTLSAENKEYDKPEMSCWLALYDDYFHAIVYVLFVLPLIVLSIVISAMLLVYICLTGRKTSGDARPEAEVEDLRMTTVASWTVSIAAIGMMLPLTVLDSYGAMFHMGIKYQIYASTYMTYLARGAFVPLFWLIVPELRSVVKNLVMNGVQKLGILKRGSSTQFLYQRDMD